MPAITRDSLPIVEKDPGTGKDLGGSLDTLHSMYSLPFIAGRKWKRIYALVFCIFLSLLIFCLINKLALRTGACGVFLTAPDAEYAYWDTESLAANRIWNHLQPTLTYYARNWTRTVHS